ncbi:Sec-independent protein translocase subunit TatA [Nocardia sp. alder85J]|uniref:Sec-independent protein translocase subunit TatA n=1 Tax=Nocardia sp. alder85J TaxID=2862949 RepID=UPI001CD6B3A7|nr:Sec-independent protein translocase subunit TatA [Nocardia sp. alder85J]MCX4092806.1 Sec-independent protein translocase subunit TatA [Nocardia sp. alder85J]
MGSLSATHWLLIALVFVLLFGAKRLPDAARGLGRSLRIFKSEMQEMQTEGGKSAPAAGTPAASTPAPAELPSAQPTVNPAAQANPDLHKA